MGRTPHPPGRDPHGDRRTSCWVSSTGRSRGLTLALPDVLGTKVGRLVAEHFADPARLAGLGESRFIRFAATRGLQVRRPVAARLVAAARDALPTRDAVVAREMLADDLRLLEVFDAAGRRRRGAPRCGPADSPRSRSLTTVPGWAVVRASGYGAAVGDPARWPGPRQVYRASGLSPMQYESAGKRRDGAISREGSVALRRALIDLGIGLWLNEAGRQGLRRRAEGPRQEGRGHRLRVGPPRQPHRLRAWSATSPATTRAAGPADRPGGLSRDRLFTSARDRGHARSVTKGRIRRRIAMADPQGYAATSLAPGPSPLRSSNDAR